MQTQRYFATLSYYGKNFSGFQVQPKKRTIQDEIEKSLLKILGEKTRIIPSGRTDKGVHGILQTFHFDIKTSKAQFKLAQKKFLIQINSVLPNEIAIHSIKKISSEFHARKSTIKKTYVYVILFSKIKNPFLDNFCVRLPYKLNKENMKNASKHLLGTHDFSSFSASDTEVKSKIRTIETIDFKTRNPFGFLSLPKNQFLVIEFTGTGFLKQMIRNIMGTLIDVGKEKTSPLEFKKILLAKDRKKAGKTAPAHGLYLKRVSY